jgi:hypothetical protein
VFDDRNGNGIRDPREPGCRGVRVSNQREVVVTDAQGRYELPAEDDMIVFVVKPKGWASPTDSTGIARSFYVHKPQGSPALRFAGVAPTGALPQSVDFALRRHKEPNRFRVLLFGDTQPRNQQEIDYIAHDVVEDLVGSDAAFGITLGDIVFDNLALFGSIKRTIGLIGIPWVYVHGNHDTNADAPDDARSDETWEREFGPAYHSFDVGQVHFVALDDIQWLPRTAGQAAGYTGGLGAKQLEWLRNDLKHVPLKQRVVLMMHIPMEGIAERGDLFRLLEGRPNTFSVSAHTHTQEHRFLGKEAGWNGAEPHHHLISATVCGSWWSGAPDERGIPHATMSDGAPNGHSVLTFDGNRYSIAFVAAGRPTSYQMAIHAPEEVVASDADAAEVVVNVFAGSSRSTVEMRVGGSGPWVRMAHSPRVDPAYAALKLAETGGTPPPGRALPGASTSSHIWAAKLPVNLAVGAHAVTVRATDMFGQVYEASRIVRVR